MKSHHIVSWMPAAVWLAAIALCSRMLVRSGPFLFFRKIASSMHAIAAILIFGLPCTLPASLGTLSAPYGDYEYHYYGPVPALSTLHADMTANFSNPDVMWGIDIYGGTFSFRLETSDLRKAPNGDWWADWVSINGVEKEYQNLGPDPLLWGLQTVYAANGASSPGAWISCYFGYPPSTYRASTIALGANGIVSAGKMSHLHARGGTSLTFNMSASAPNNNCSLIGLQATANQDESNWLYLGGNNSWQNIYYTSGTSGSFSYPINPSVRHYYFLARSMGDTTSAPAIIHVEVTTTTGTKANTIMGWDVLVCEGQEIWPGVDYGSFANSTRGISWNDDDGSIHPYQYMISGYTNWVTVTGYGSYDDETWMPPHAGDYQIYYKQRGNNEWDDSNVAGPYTLHVLPATPNFATSVTAQNITAQVGTITQATFASAMNLNLTPAISYKLHVIIGGYGKNPNFKAIPAGTYSYQIEIEPDLSRIYGDFPGGYFPGSFTSPTYTLTVESLPAVNGAAFLSQNVPSTMQAGATTTVSVVMSNNGSTTWNNNTPYPYSLGSQNPQDNYTWGFNRVSVGGTPVQPGDTKTFTFAITAPSALGTYSFQWRMVQDGQEWFGAASSNVTIQVSDTTPPTVPANVTASDIASNGAMVTWSASVDNVGVADYQILVDGSVVGVTNNLFYPLALALPSTTYAVTVRAMDAADNLSSPSAPISITTLPRDPNAPPQLPYRWAHEHGLNSNDGLGDADGDGLTNFAEYNLATDPNQYNAGSSMLGDAMPVGWPTPRTDIPQAVGTTAGEFSVDKNGAATYTIPIAVTPGTAGMEPKITLNYNSQAGPGIAGYGWSIGGLSVITRGPQTKRSDGRVRGMDFSSNDRFYLDGQRLIAINNVAYGHDSAEYRTELDTFTRVVSYGVTGNSPAWFKAWTKNGLIIEFGHTSDSAFCPQNQADPLSWAVSKISDTAGNYMTLHYEVDAANGNQVLKSIKYTGHDGKPVLAPYASLEFEYDPLPRPDASIAYVAGAKISSLKRLAAIKACYGTTVVRTYTLNYIQREYNHRSILESVTESAMDGMAYNPIVFEYSNPDYGWDHNFTLRPPVTLGNVNYKGSPINDYVPDSNFSSGVAFIDLNGDGLVDCVQKTKSTSHAWLNTVNGWVEAVGANGQPDYRLPDGCQLVGGRTPSQVRFVDLNQDGLVDVTSDYGTAYLNTGSGFVLSKKYSFAGDFGINANFVDINGDGTPDLLLTSAWDYPSSSRLETWVFTNNGGGDENVPGSAWSHSVGLANHNWWYIPAAVLPCPFGEPGVRYVDLNGDSLVDAVYIYYDLLTHNYTRKAWINTGSGFVDNTNYTPPITTAFGWKTNKGIINYTGAEFVDLNGDGLPDIVTSSSHGVIGSQAWINTGSKWIQDYGYAPPISLTNIDSDGNIIPNGCAFIDVNNDGLPDLVRSYGQHGRAVWINTGSSWTPGTPDMNLDLWISLCKNGSPGTVLNDFNGDGLVDIIWACGSVYSYGGMATNKRANSDKLIKAISSFGVPVSIEYAPLTEVPSANEESVYEKGSGELFPAMDVTGPLFVVKTISYDSGTGGGYDISFRYGGLRTHTDYGNLGFAWIQSTDSRTGIRTKTLFNHEYPFIGLPAGSITELANGNPLSETVTTYEYLSLNNDKTIFPYATITIQRTYDPKADLTTSLTSETVTTYTYDADTYGDPVVIEIDTSGGNGIFTKTITNTYDNLVTVPSQSSLNCWMLGRLISSTVTTKAPNPDGPEFEQTRTSDFEYDSDTGLLTKEIIEPGTNSDPSLQLITTYTHDPFGNKKTENTTDKTLSLVRTATTTYDSIGRFAIKNTNAVGHEESYDYDPALGVLLSTTGPNGLTTSWEYDGFARKTLEKRANGTQTTTNYHWTGSSVPLYYVETQSTGAPPSVVFYNKMGRAISSWNVHPGGIDGAARIIITDTQYDRMGRAHKTSLPYYKGATPADSDWSEIAYDILNRPMLISTPDDEVDGGAVISTIEYAGLVTRTVNPLAQVEEVTKDTQGRIIKRVNNATGTGAERGEIRYTYNANNNLIKTAVYGENGTPAETTFEYDNRGRKTSMTDPDMGTWYYKYNALGELTSQTDAKGQTTEMTYDVLGRLKTRVDRDSSNVITCTTTWAYDDTTLSGAKGIGKISTVLVETPGGTPDYKETLTYDYRGRQSAITRLIDNKNYSIKQEYDPITGFPTVTEYPDGFRVRNVYNAFGFLKEVRADGGGVSSGIYRDVQPNHLFWQADSYAMNGSVDGSTLGNGLTCDRIISSKTGRLLAITTGIGSNTFAQNHTYSYDLLGQVVKRKDSILNRDESFTYDGLNRLVAYSTNNSLATTVSYDALGNITQKSDVGKYYYASGRPHAVVSAGTLNYVYDANGNQIESNRAGTVERTMEWSTANHVQKVTSTSGNLWTTFRFGAARERIAQEHSDGSKTIYIGSHLEIVIGLGNTREEKYHVYTPEGKVATRTLRAGSTVETRYYHTDGLGSIVAVSDEYGRIEKRFAYDPWGQRVMDFDTHADWGGAITRGFTGHEHLEDFGLIHMNGRIFDPKLARFLSPDSYVQSLGNSQTFNRYSYCFNSPLTFIDPNGEIVWWPIIVGAIIGAYSGGVIANEGEYNPTKWNYNNSKTWRFMGYGAVVGAASGYIGAELIAAGASNTFAMAYSSFVYSWGTHVYTNGQTPVSISFGAASWNITNNKWGYLGKSGNNGLQNFGYGFGALNNAYDLAYLINGGAHNLPSNIITNNSGMSAEEAAELASSTYAMGNAAPSGSYVRSVYTIAGDGTDAVLFGKYAIPDNLFLSFRGTATLRDWFDNIVNALPFIKSSRYVAAVKLAEAVGKANPGYNIILIGHSLGGGQAALAGAATGFDTITINASGVNPMKYFGSSFMSNYGNITNFNVPWEPLTFLQRITPLPNALGNQVSVSPFAGPSFINIYNHGIASYIY